MEKLFTETGIKNENRVRRSESFARNLICTYYTSVSESFDGSTEIYRGIYSYYFMYIYERTYTYLYDCAARGIIIRHIIIIFRDFRRVLQCARRRYSLNGSCEKSFAFQYVLYTPPNAYE